MSAEDGRTARSTDLLAIGAAVRELRSRRGLSQQALADSVGIHRTALARFEQGKQDIGMSNLRGLAMSLGDDPAMVLVELATEAGWVAR